MTEHEIVSRAAWLEARKALLAKEKQFNKLRDELSRERRALPWVKLDESYPFDGPNGKETLADLFGDRSQLVVYHFMFPDSWQEGCKSCSFWADNFNGVLVHLRARDVSFAVVSKGSYPKLAAFQKRMGWSFKWVSSASNAFNRDFGVSFTPDEMKSDEKLYNFGTLVARVEEMPGISVFAKNAAGEVFHTYSTYARGLDMLNVCYHYLDLVPKGRDEEGLSYSMAWLRHHDRY